MFSYSGCIRKSLFFPKPFQWSRVLIKCPHAKGRVVRLRITTPRKPNSARRKTVKLKLRNKKEPVSYVTGGAHNLKRFSTVLIQGKGARDLPGVYSRCIRGKFDLAPVADKKRRRSIYGVPRF